MSSSERQVAPGPAWVLYDGACGVCRTQAGFWAPILGRRGFEVLPLQDERVKARLVEVDGLLDDFRVVTRDGRMFVGSEAYRHAMKRIGWLRPIYWLSMLPGFRWVFDRLYRTLADRRHGFRRCAR
jgi:predicted DCC family thiol-disulfide oxidoreductase YuxK